MVCKTKEEKENVKELTQDEWQILRFAGLCHLHKEVEKTKEMKEKNE